MRCPTCNNNKQVIKAGIRQTKKGTIQRFYCKKCNTYFSNTTQPYTQYPLHVILYTLQLYNQGYPIQKAKTLTGRKYRYYPPIQTIYSWIAKYQNTLGFLKLRKKYVVDPKEVTTTIRFNHQQLYPFAVHNLKLNLKSKQLPQLTRYINWIKRSLPTKIFLSGPRASQCNINQKITINQKETIAPDLTKYALATQQKNQSAHDVVEQFFLYNDSSTVCTELPVFLNPKETNLFDIETPLTGHIDIIQIRNNNLYIMDYKPNLRHPEQHTSQLTAYKQALHHRTQIPEENIMTAVFNEWDYYEFR